MCDFRKPPLGVRNIDTGEVIWTPECRPVNGTSHPKKFSVTEPGMYYIYATGSHYSYFDGEYWWEDRNDWGPPSDKYWQELGGYPPPYAKYEFIRPEDDR